jgi:adhesin/invasin
MNSSGIKRGLAVSAVSALAVAGIPALASSASAAAGDTITVTSTGPARNGGDLGADVVLRVKDGTVVPGDLKLTSTTSSAVGSQNTADQSASIVGADAPVNDTADSAYDLITAHISVTTSATGDTATFRIFEDEAGLAGNNTLDAAEPRATVSLTTAGAAAALDVSPASQSTPQGIESGAYTVTVKDAQGRTTQLQAADTIAVNADADITVNAAGPSITAAEISDGTATFTATPGAAAPVGARTLTLDGPGAVDKTATLTITKSAVLDATMVDIVTGADSWDGFGDGNFGAPNTVVRVDQNTFRIDIKGGAANANSNVSLNLSSTGGITFGGKATATVATTLDADGNGALTFTADAGTVQETDTIVIGGSISETLEFARAAVSDVVPSSGTYFSKVGGSVDVTVQVVDQFGLPVTSGFVEAKRDGVNAAADATPQRKAVGADGKVTFTFTDTQAVNGNQENVDVDYFADQFSATPDFSEGNVAVIKYTTDGMGANFVTTLDGTNTEGADYDATDVVVVPLADTVADDEAPAINESAAIALSTGGEPNTAMTISVDKDALILAPGETLLSEGSSSVTATLDGGGLLAAGYRVIGTKSGVVTVTLSAANRTETAQMTVAAESDRTTARNVTVSGPAEVEHGTTQIPFVAVVTDGFGNPVANVPVTDLNVQVTGPALFQDSDVATNADGQLALNVRVDADAEGPVTIKVTGIPAANNQFGAAADQLTASSAANSGKGLPASAAEATAATTVKAADVPVPPVAINLHLSNAGSMGKRDKIKANADDTAAGLTAVLFRNGNRVKAHALNSAGDFTFKVRDLNGNKKKTRYTVKVRATDTTKAATQSIRIK